MPRLPFARAARATIVVVLLGACTSAPVSSVGSPSPQRPSATPSVTTDAPSQAAPPTTGGPELTASHVTIRLPAGGSFRVRGTYPWSPSRCVHQERTTLDGKYPGTLSIRTIGDGTLTLTVTLTFQRYLEGIAEVPPTWPAAALEAQAIAARSYVLSTTGWTGAQGTHLATPICGTSACQVYGGIPIPRPAGLRRWYRAVRDTTGEVLMYGGRPADTVYFSTSNGQTYGNDEIFGSSPLPYLRPVVERDDGASPLSRWRVALPFRDLAPMLIAAGSWPVGVPITSAAAVGSVVRLAGGGQTRAIDAGTLRDDVNTWGPCLMPRRYPSGGLPVAIPSGWFHLSAGSRGLAVDGRGWGHGVGMVQWGAYAKAARGWSTSKILAFYYGGLRPQRYAEPGTLDVVVASGLRSMTVDPSAAGATVDGSRFDGTLRIVGGDEVTVTSPA